MAAFKENSKEKNLFYLFNKKVLTTIKQTISRMKFLESLQPFKLYIKAIEEAYHQYTMGQVSSFMSDSPVIMDAFFGRSGPLH